MTLLRFALPGLLAALAAGAAAAPDAAAGSGAVTAAERLVFSEPQLANVRPPAALRYGFSHGGTLDAPWQDDVRLELKAKPAGGCCVADGRFLSGARAVLLPTIDDAVANPVILFFLEHDVRDMQRRTGGQQAHFRRRIRLALAESAEVRDTTVRHAGRDWPAKEVRVRPYLDDPNRDRFEKLATKEYVFVLAPGVPGGVWQLRSRVPAPAADAPPLLEDTVTLAEPTR